MTGSADEPIVIFTIGHSTRSIEEFVALLKHCAIKMVADVRTIPNSRYNPQFNSDTLPGSLTSEGIGYIHLAGLGGLRHAHTGSLNMGWRNASFRGFADYMQTRGFRTSLDQLIELPHDHTVAIMCAEAVPWRCHRSLIADALLVRNINVQEIIGIENVKTHTLTPWAKTNGDEITYPVSVSQ